MTKTILKPGEKIEKNFYHISNFEVVTVKSFKFGITVLLGVFLDWNSKKLLSHLKSAPSNFSKLRFCRGPVFLQVQYPPLLKVQVRVRVRFIKYAFRNTDRKLRNTVSFFCDKVFHICSSECKYFNSRILTNLYLSLNKPNLRIN